MKYQPITYADPWPTSSIANPLSQKITVISLLITGDNMVPGTVGVPYHGPCTIWTHLFLSGTLGAGVVFYGIKIEKCSTNCMVKVC